MAEDRDGTITAKLPKGITITLGCASVRLIRRTACNSRGVAMIRRKFAGAVLLLMLIGCGQDACPPSDTSNSAPTPEKSANDGTPFFDAAQKSAEQTVDRLMATDWL